MAQAIPYWQQAGQRFIERSANLEAIGHLTKGLEVLDPTGHSRPDSARTGRADRPRPSVAGHQEQGGPRLALASHPGAGTVSSRWEIFTDSPVLFGLWTSYIVRPELQTARELGEQLLRLGGCLKPGPPRAEAHWVLGLPCSSWERLRRRERIWST